MIFPINLYTVGKNSNYASGEADQGNIQQYLVHQYIQTYCRRSKYVRSGYVAVLSYGRQPAVRQYKEYYQYLAPRTVVVVRLASAICISTYQVRILRFSCFKGVDPTSNASLFYSLFLYYDLCRSPKKKYAGLKSLNTR